MDFVPPVLLLCDGLTAGPQALANALLAIVADEKLAASIREDPPAFELLRTFQVTSCCFLVDVRSLLDRGFCLMRTLHTTSFCTCRSQTGAKGLTYCTGFEFT